MIIGEAGVVLERWIPSFAALRGWAPGETRLIRTRRTGSARLVRDAVAALALPGALWWTAGAGAVGTASPTLYVNYEVD